MPESRATPETLFVVEVLVLLFSHSTDTEKHWRLQSTQWHINPIFNLHLVLPTLEINI